MVFLTNTLYKIMPKWLPRKTGMHPYLKKQALFRYTQFFPYRWRNCWRIARREWIRKLQTDQRFRQARVKELFFRDIWNQRIYAACQEYGIEYKYFIASLPKLNIELDRKSLATLAIWEPRSFQSLVELARAKACEMAVDDQTDLTPPPGVITRGML